MELKEKLDAIFNSSFIFFFEEIKKCLDKFPPLREKKKLHLATASSRAKVSKSLQAANTIILTKGYDHEISKY